MGCKVAKILAWTPLPMTPERHIWACANTLITQHGEDAWFHASMRADALLEAGDLDGHKMFKAILSQIEDLQRMEPVGSIH
jgi:hypothetical protein